MFDGQPLVASYEILKEKYKISSAEEAAEIIENDARQRLQSGTGILSDNDAHTIISACINISGYFEAVVAPSVAKHPFIPSRYALKIASLTPEALTEITFFTFKYQPTPFAMVVSLADNPFVSSDVLNYVHALTRVTASPLETRLLVTAVLAANPNVEELCLTLVVEYLASCLKSDDAFRPETINANMAAIKRILANSKLPDPIRLNVLHGALETTDLLTEHNLKTLLETVSPSEEWVDDAAASRLVIVGSTV